MENGGNRGFVNLFVVRVGSVTGTSDDRALEFVFFEGFQRRWAAAQDIVAGDAVKDMDAVIVQQGGLGNGPFGAGAALLALL